MLLFKLRIFSTYDLMRVGFKGTAKLLRVRAFISSIYGKQNSPPHCFTVVLDPPRLGNQNVRRRSDL